MNEFGVLSTYCLRQCLYVSHCPRTFKNRVDFEDFMLAGLDFKPVTVQSMIHFQSSRTYEWKVCVYVCARACLFV